VAVGGNITVDNMTIYQLTETRLALQVTVKGTKYWKDEKLNYWVPIFEALPQTLLNSFA
jgi:hypothetical protein